MTTRVVKLPKTSDMLEEFLGDYCDKFSDFSFSEKRCATDITHAKIDPTYGSYRSAILVFNQKING